VGEGVLRNVRLYAFYAVRSVGVSFYRSTAATGQQRIYGGPRLQLQCTTPFSADLHPRPRTIINCLFINCGHHQSQRTLADLLCRSRKLIPQHLLNSGKSRNEPARSGNLSLAVLCRVFAQAGAISYSSLLGNNNF